MKTYVAKRSDIQPGWHVIDASGRTLGKLATEAATILMGKHKPTYTPHCNTGDFVVVINAASVRVTGKKAEQKIYYRHSGYPGGLKSTSFARLMETHPTRAVQYAVKGMLPKNRLGRDMLKRLKVYAGDTHPHQGQVAKREQGGAG